ncbi:uncharacterized protein B0H18DRAFT_639231 [Fomitopsis serialis]|uniref:uncharacterized protein n=1 Tax=Fomitopsis serialis TaxID=139415 RepID=UPI002007637C|nr:uncharacterized protein B0H18DRAFT_639231 [Neoantrodia serialis]KAH9919319.1 hypothetical protein B0H18DRAFT_639231 [Neoantrodia serialis]
MSIFCSVTRTSFWQRLACLHGADHTAVNKLRSGCHTICLTLIILTVVMRPPGEKAASEELQVNGRCQSVEGTRHNGVRISNLPYRSALKIHRDLKQHRMAVVYVCMSMLSDPSETAVPIISEMHNCHEAALEGKNEPSRKYGAILLQKSKETRPLPREN